MSMSTSSSFQLISLSKDFLSSNPSFSPPPSLSSRISPFPVKLAKINNGSADSSLKRDSVLGSEASRKALPLSQALKTNKMTAVETDRETNLFDEMKDRFLSFKRETYMKNLDQFQKLANAQSPKFMVIACGDSRVCPSNILGFQPGDAFMIRNVANLVPPFESRPFETKAALEFAVTSLEVENILVIGHSCCGGIRALMSMEDEALISGQDGESSSFIKNWVVVGKNARLSTKAAAGNLNFDQQCRHCEKESVNRSLMNLLTYPWIEERVNKGSLSIHGGYYDFVDCTFEKWTLNSSEGNEGDKYSIQNRQFWS